MQFHLQKGQFLLKNWRYKNFYQTVWYCEFSENSTETQTNTLRRSLLFCHQITLNQIKSGFLQINKWEIRVWLNLFPCFPLISFLWHKVVFWLKTTHWSSKKRHNGAKAPKQVPIQILYFLSQWTDLFFTKT